MEGLEMIYKLTDIDILSLIANTANDNRVYNKVLSNLTNKLKGE
jgi:hypothetical protein